MNVAVIASANASANANPSVNGRSSHGPLALALAAFAIIAVQSLRRHLALGSTGKDLGLFHQSHWLISRGLPPDNTILGMHALGDHAELVDWLAAPFQWLWPHASTLLVLQAACVASGAGALASLATRRLDSRLAGVLLGASFVAAIDLQNAVMFDWNPTTCGAGLLPWVAWAFERRRPWAFAAALGAVGACKENLLVYAGALSVALALEAFWDGRRRASRPTLSVAYGFGAAAVLAAVFGLELTWLIPSYRAGGFRHGRYEQLGPDGVAALAFVLQHPLDAAALLVTPADKLSGLLAAVAGTLGLVVAAPAYLVPLAPVVLERFWSTAPNRWWGYHYGAALAALGVLAAISAIARLSARAPGAPRLRLALAFAVLAATLAVALALPASRAPLFARHQGYDERPDDVRDALAVLAVIPPDAAVAAQNQLLPHLSARREVFELSRPVRAPWVALNTGLGAWPFADDYPARLGRELRQSGYGVVACAGKAMVLARGHADGPCAALDAALP